MKKQAAFGLIATSLLFLGATSFSQIHISGPQSGTLIDTTYIVDGNISVEQADSLMIEPGAALLFDGHYAFSIYGFLLTDGTESDSVLFMPNHGVETWRGIHIYSDASDDSRLSHCFLSGSDSCGISISYCSPTIEHCSIISNSSWGDGGGISLWHSNAYILWCEISENRAGASGPTFDNYGGGIACCAHSSPNIDHCTITENAAQSGGGILCLSESNAQIADCYIGDNYGISWGGGVYCISASPTISNCVITGNYASMGGGFSCFANAEPILVDCMISNNASHSVGGVHVEIGSSATLDGCVITGNISDAYDGAVRVMQNAHLDIINCTIFDNSANQNSRGISLSSHSSLSMLNTIVARNAGIGVRVEDDCQVAVRYCDFYGNTEGNFYGNVPDSLGEITMLNANGDSCDYFYNIFLDPQFVDISAGDYHLLTASPCIDAGDPNSPRDPDSTIADIGAYYYDQSTGVEPSNQIEPPTTFRLMQNYPNPFNATTVITYELPRESRAQLAIFNILGQHVSTLFDGLQQMGEHSVTWDAMDIPSGIYFARLQTGSETKTIQVILLK